MPGLIFLVAAIVQLVGKVSIELFSYGFVKLSTAGVTALLASVAHLWGALNVGNPVLKQTKHFARGIIVGIVLFIIYLVPFAIVKFLTNDSFALIEF